MERVTAEELVQEYLKYGSIMTRLVELAMNLDAQDKRKIVEASANACSELYEGVLRTVVQYHPDLEPENHRN